MSGRVGRGGEGAHCELLEQRVGHKEVQSWVDGKVECLQGHGTG